ncbi:galactose mutarotase [Litoribacter alkaliphilus]|uniref:Aldose 1-epimerase n=1 Tax=Litoribacter ruber TaxID=702568 RepID=A0AAP2CEF3_9BACT|nr:aldose epimerase family protein [Litoribacter alkaliphilus]MBS9522783.1 galactose mutarotase [Litoribacter alkaliphilus]
MLKRSTLVRFVFPLLIGLVASCTNPNTYNSKLKILTKNSGKTISGKEIQIFELENKSGTQVSISNFGGVITNLKVADRDGQFEDIVLGFDDISEYPDNGYFFGATIGRYANRIAGGKFSLDEKQFQLTKNDSDNHLHGGVLGYDEVVWEAEPFEEDDKVGVKLTYVSQDGEEGYPGTVQNSAVFTLNNDNVLTINFEATTDESTIINMTHHGYFNLSGMQENVLDHTLKIFGEKYTPVNRELIPTGELRSVKDTPFDFREEKQIGVDIQQVEGGYDHNFVIKEGNSRELKLQAELHHEGSGRFLALYSDAPGLQFYSGNFLDGVKGKSGKNYDKHMGLCLEPQAFPDSPNQPNFPSVRLDKGQTYQHTIEYHFKIK